MAVYDLVPAQVSICFLSSLGDVLITSLIMTKDLTGIDLTEEGLIWAYSVRKDTVSHGEEGISVGA